MRKNILLTVYFMLFAACLVYYFLSRPTKKPSDLQILAKNKLREIANTGYDQDSPSDRRELEEVRAKFGVTDWRDMGFQRADSPVTDFRAFGMLTLKCLELTEAHKKIHKYGTHEAAELPFALTYINIGSTYLSLLETNPSFLARHSFTQDGYVQEFVNYVDRVIVDFEDFWLKTKPENIMTFNSEWRRYQSKYLK